MGSKSFSQTYTSNSNGNWNNAGRWTITNTAGCGSPIPNTPPVATNNRACQINIIINHNVNGLNDLDIGNNNQVSIQIAANRTLTINRDLSVTGYNNKSLTLSGSGNLNVGDDFSVSGNSNITISGDLDINVDDITEITQAAQFEADGNIQFSSSRITIDGNGSLNFTASINSIFESTGNNRDFIIRGGSNVTFSGTSGIISNRDVIIDGNTPSIIFEDDSFMESRDLLLSDGGNIQLSGGSSLLIGSDFEIDDSFTLEFFDDSELNIGSDMTMLGGSQLIFYDNADLVVGDDLEMEDQSTITLNNDASISISDNAELVDQSKILGNDNSQIVIEGELSLDDQSTFSMDDNSTLLVEGDVEVTTNNLANGIRFSGNSVGTFDSDVLFDGNSSTLNLSDDSTVTISGTLVAEGGADLFVSDSGNLTLNSTLTIDNGGTTLNLSVDSEIVIAGNSNIDGGADVIISGNSRATLRGNLNFDNNNGTSWTSSGTSVVLIEGNFSKGSRSDLDVTNSSVFEICTGTFPLESSDSNINVAPSPAYYGGCRILPVDYLYFETKYNTFSRSGDLSWATAKEWENDRFEVERSVNNVTSWEKIGIIDGAGYSDGSIDYDYQDLKLPVAGGNIFYRLKQVDFDGKFSFSDTKSIKVEALPGTTQWRIFPNPTTGYPFNIEILDPSAYRDEPVTLRAISPTGQYEFIQVDEIRQMGAQVSNYFEQKASGVYTIEIAWGAKREYHKVILRR